jgi:TPR repeat protein
VSGGKALGAGLIALLVVVGGVFALVWHRTAPPTTSKPPPAAPDPSRCGSLPVGCLDAVDRYLGDPSMAVTAAAELDRLCKDGRREGCDGLVPFLAAGAGVARDPDRALQLSQQGCDAKDLAACNNLGILYLGGVGVVKDEARALKLFDGLCREHNQPRACFNAAALYDAGPVTIRDPTKAADYYTRLCNFGEPNSCFNLGNLYLDGRGVAKDADKAKALHTLACRSGLKAACR